MINYAGRTRDISDREYFDHHIRTLNCLQSGLIYNFYRSFQTGRNEQRVRIVQYSTGTKGQRNRTLNFVLVLGKF